MSSYLYWSKPGYKAWIKEKDGSLTPAMENQKEYLQSIYNQGPPDYWPYNACWCCQKIRAPKSKEWEPSWDHATDCPNLDNPISVKRTKTFLEKFRELFS